jgi:hypothetical protein
MIACWGTIGAAALVVCLAGPLEVEDGVLVVYVPLQGALEVVQTEEEELSGGGAGLLDVLVSGGGPQPELLDEVGTLLDEVDGATLEEEEIDEDVDAEVVTTELLELEVYQSGPCAMAATGRRATRKVLKSILMVV